MSRRMWLVSLLGLGFFTFPLAAITLDVKTKLSEKVELAACKIGLVSFLERAGIGVQETGEDFTIWLTNLQKTQKGNVISARVEIHLTKPSVVTEGPSLERTVVEFEYSSEPGFLTGYLQTTGTRTDPKTVDQIKATLVAKTELALAEGVTGGDALAQAIIAMLKQQGYKVKS